jgi:hypothetical protein
MANTYTQIYLHVVFAVSGRACLMSSLRREELQKYITGIVTRKGQKLIAIYCMPDHTHILLGLKPSIAPSDLIGDSRPDRPITSMSRSGSDAGSPGRKALARFPFRIRMWIAWPTTFAIKTCIIAKNHFNKNISNFWSGIASRSINAMFSNP